MATVRRNLVILLSDEHDPRYMGSSGHPFIKTPNLDRLAARGRRFSNATTPSPICVPARAAMATGEYVNSIGYWDNAIAYDGRIPSWGHRLQQDGHRVESIGKLHYRDANLSTGFDRQHTPMHISGGKGMIWASIRDPLPDIGYDKRPRMIGKKVGSGESSYTEFDRNTARLAIEWLQHTATQPTDRPWVLFVGFVAPHFPLIAPPEFADLYPPACVPPFKLRTQDGYRRHPWLQAMHDYFPHDDAFSDEAERREAVRMYFALCSFLDSNVGLVLDAIQSSGLASTTNVIYASDHGDNLGSRGMWGKSTLYQESVAVPLILAGPDLAPKVVEDVVSLVDLFPTVLDSVGIAPDKTKPGRSLFAEQEPGRAVLSEYHAVGAPSGAFMTRKGRWKYNYYVGYRPELFDLSSDPEELCDLAGDSEYRAIIEDLHRQLLAICDPEDVDRRAKADQAALVRGFGGRELALQFGNSEATPAPQPNR